MTDLFQRLRQDFCCFDPDGAQFFGGSGFRKAGDLCDDLSAPEPPAPPQHPLRHLRRLIRDRFSPRRAIWIPSAWMVVTE
jgi:hypothetical protein